MDRAERLRMISRYAYYLGWLASIVAAIGHVARFNLWLSNTLGISGRNLLEAGLMLFLACIASELRAAHVVTTAKPQAAKAQAG